MSVYVCVSVSVYVRPPSISICEVKNIHLLRSKIYRYYFLLYHSHCYVLYKFTPCPLYPYSCSNNFMMVAYILSTMECWKFPGFKVNVKGSYFSDTSLQDLLECFKHLQERCNKFVNLRWEQGE